MDQCQRMHFPMTHNEAREFPADGTLPEGFDERVKNFLEFDYCSNCDGRECMGCVMREWDHECAADCPMCCEPSVAARNGDSAHG